MIKREHLSTIVIGTVGNRVELPWATVANVRSEQTQVPAVESAEGSFPWRSPFAALD